MASASDKFLHYLSSTMSSKEVRQRLARSREYGSYYSVLEPVHDDGR